VSRGAILVVEDDRVNRLLLVRLLGLDGYDVHAVEDGECALAFLETHAPDVILLDLGLPDIDGFELCRRIKKNPATRLTPVVMVTALSDRSDRIEGITAGADDFLSKPFDSEELRARVRSLVRLKRYTDDLESAESVILSLALTVEARDAYTEGHCERLARYAIGTGEALRLPEADLAALYRGGYLHDVGKIGVPDSVLQKPAKLTPVESELMRRHPLIGERLCGNLRSLGPVRSIVRHHHERFDGSGYPDGLSGNDVPLLAQIVSIVDAYDAITSTRPYHAAASPEHAFAELRADVSRGCHRADLVEAFIEASRSGGWSESRRKGKGKRWKGVIADRTSRPST
jgi:putative two-component system response regulator